MRAIDCATLAKRRSAIVPPSVDVRFRALLLGSVAAGVLLAGGTALAGEIDWKPDVEGDWSSAGNWVGAVVPGSADAASVSSGYVEVGGAQAAGSLELSGGVVSVTEGFSLDVDTVTISGEGNFNVSGGDDAAITNIGSALTLTGGTLDGDGLVIVATGDGHGVSQSGGEVGGMLTIDTPRYVLSGGAIGDAVTINTDSFSFEGGATSMQGTVNFADLFSLSPDSEEEVTIDGRLTGTGRLVKSGGSTVRLTNGGNDFTGGISIEAGVLQGDSGVVPRTGSIDVAAGATFRNTGGTAAYSGTLSGDGTFVLDSWDQFGVGGGTVDMGGLDVVYGTFRVGTSYFDAGEDNPAPGASIDAKFDHVHLGREVPEDADDDYSDYGAIMIEHGSTLNVDSFDMTAGHLWSEANEADASLPAGKLVANSVTQSGGLVESIDVSTTAYSLSGGRFAGALNVDDFTFSGGEIAAEGAVTINKSLTVSGGELALDGLDALEKFSLLGGKFTGAIGTGTYEYGGGTLVGTVDVSDALVVSGGTLTVGDGTVTLGRDADAFTISIDAGTLNVLDAALPDEAAVKVGKDGTLQFTIGDDTETLFAGTMDGSGGSLVKAGGGTLVLTNNITLGDLAVNAGKLKIGDGTSTETASFDSAVIARDASLYIASGATLEIRVPNHLTNNGTLVNDGTVIDDLDNTGSFANNHDYNADVASNTGHIDNNQPGVWTGDIKSNAGEIVNKWGATWDGAVEGNTASIVNYGTWKNGTVTNGNENSDPDVLDEERAIINYIDAQWTGDIAENYAWVFNTGGTWTGDVLSNHGNVWNDNGDDEVGTGYWIGDVVSNDDWVFNGGGGDWTGDVLANGYHGVIKNDGSTDDGGATWHADWHGDVYGNGGDLENQGWWDGDVIGNSGFLFNSGKWVGDVIAAGTVTSAKTGNVANIGNIGTVSNDTDGTWIGDVNANAGTVVNAGHWTGDVLANSGTVKTIGTWTGNITSAGTLKAGSTITGALTNAGTLQLEGNLSVGSVSFGGDSHFKIDIGADGVTEKLTSTGLAQLDGIVQVKAGSGLTEQNVVAPYTFLTAGSISGEFDGVTTDLAFLTPTLHYTGTTASLEFARNDQTFSNTGVTDNQKAIGGRVEALGSGNDIYDAVIVLTAEQAQDAFDQLSGEAHASASGVAANNAALLGNIALDRLDATFRGVEAGGAGNGYAAAPVLEADGSVGLGLWTQLYGAYGTADGTGTSGVEGSTGGIAAGLDGLIGDWRLGVMLDAGTSRISVADLGSTIDSTDYGLGAYAGGDFGGTRLTLAGTYTRHDNSSARSVDFPGFTEDLSASYASDTWQLGGRLSHEFDFGAFSLTPYAGAGYVNHQTDGFSETGGAAALGYAANTVEQTTVTLGSTAGYQTVIGDGMLLTASASLGWSHAFGDARGADITLGGGAPVTIIGTAAAADLATLGLGLNLDVNDATTLDITYGGELGIDTRTHAITGTWATRF